MALVDDEGRQALRSRRADVVLVLHVEHGRARDPGDDSQRDSPKSDCGQDQVLQHVDERAPVPRHDRIEDVEVRRVAHISGDVDSADARQPPQLDGEDVFQHEAEKEDRYRNPYQRGEETHLIADATVVLRSQEPEWDAQHQSEQHRGER